MEETQLRAVKLLVRAIREHKLPVIAHLNVPVLIPGEKGITSVEPLKSLYEKLPAIGMEKGLWDASIFVGMPWTDVPRAGMSVQVVAADKSSYDQAVSKCRSLAEEIWAHRRELTFDVPAASLEDAVASALRSTASTVFITDSGDNTTAGAAGDNPGVLKYLVEHHIRDVIIAGIVDPPAIRICENSGMGSKVRLSLGGKIDTVFGKPYGVDGRVEYLTKQINPANPLRRSAIIDVSGIKVVLLNQIRSFTSPEDFKEIGIDPLTFKIVVVKLGYLFPGLRDIAPETIMALTPGFANQVIEDLPYEHVRRPIFPLDPDMTWESD
jgi:microcystin degradation protein MlrC